MIQRSITCGSYPTGYLPFCRNRLSSQLSLLGCSSGSKAFSLDPSALFPSADCQRTLLEVFFQSVAGEHVRSRLRATGLLDVSPNEAPKLLWADLFPVACSCLQAKLCPSSGEAMLAVCQFLLMRGQTHALLKLTRLLEGWWRRDPVLVSYVRGLALLNTG